MFSLQQTISYAKTFSQYFPLSVGDGKEIATSSASMIRASVLGAPMVYSWNRNKVSQVLTLGTQDYTIALTDFGFLEKATITDDAGVVTELTAVLNNEPLGFSTTATKRTNAISILILVPYVSIKVRLLDVPQQAYTLKLIYQKIAVPFVESCLTVATASGANTTYTGIFSSGIYQPGTTIQIFGFSNAGNNGNFVVVSQNLTTLVVVNGGGVNETTNATAFNLFWDPIPDFFKDVYNSLFLSECMTLNDDARAQVYRLRGVASLFSKAQGLSDTQKNIFAQQWLATGAEAAAVGIKVQQGAQGRQS